MGILDRVKNMFTEEVEEPVTKESVKVEVEEQTEVEEKEEQKVIPKKEDKMMPIFFDDQDFATLEKPKKEEHKTLIEEKYYTKKPEQQEKKVFKLSPVISPVYGVLDKNYHKEDITPKRSTPRVTYYDSESITIDEVRKKAYGTLEDEIEDTLLAKEEPVLQSRMQRNHPDDVLLEELMDPSYEPKRAKKDEVKELEKEENIIKPFALDEFLISDETEEEIDYKDPNEDTLTESDLFNLIDSMYDKEDE